MKKYKIIEDRINYNSQDFGEMGKFIRVEYALNILKEALSDKEEVKPCRGCELHALENMTGFIPNKCVGDCKPKQEKCEHDWIPYHLNKENVDIKYEYCKTCKATRIPELKQSTSLKEDLEYILDTYYSGTRSMDNAREGILKLVQSHLIKEIENECQVYACSRKCGGISPRCILDTDIIKIINNI